MLVVQEHGKLRSYGLALRRDRLLKEVILHLLGQVAPYPNNSLAQGARKLIRDHAVDWVHRSHSLHATSARRALFRFCALLGLSLLIGSLFGQSLLF